MEIDTNDPLINEYAHMLSAYSRILILQICMNPTPQSYLHKIVGVKEPTISKHVSSLVDMGLLKASKKNRVKILETVDDTIIFKILPFSTDSLFNES